MSQFQFQLKAKPKALKKAIQGIEKPRREVPKIQLSYEELAKQLPSIPQSKFKKWKLKKSAQELLPYLLIDLDTHKELRKPLFALIKAKFTPLNVRTRRRILTFGLMYPEVRKIGYQFYATSPPEPGAPRWIALYWKQMLRPQDPIESMLIILQEEKVCIVNAVSWLQINPCSQFVDPLLCAFQKVHDWSLLTSAAYQEVVQFVSSSAPKEVRKEVLVWVLNHYVGHWGDIEDVPHPYLQFLSLGKEQWGDSYGDFWKFCSEEVRALVPLLKV